MSTLINNFVRLRKDHLAGILMIAIGGYVIIEGTNYNVGTLTRMGSGFFPVALGTILCVVGASIFLAAKPSQCEAKASLQTEWRGPFSIVLGMVAFLVLGKFGGLLPATFAAVFLSALGDRENTVRSALTLAAAICLICVVVFSWGLKVQLHLFTWG